MVQDNLPDWIDDVCQDALKTYVVPGLFLFVKNEGKAISKEDGEKLFKPFYQGDEARSKKDYKGVGLGLSIAKMIIEKHKGSIGVVPVKDVGNIMFCYLKKASYRGKGKMDIKDLKRIGLGTIVLILIAGLTRI